MSRDELPLESLRNELIHRLIVRPREAGVRALVQRLHEETEADHASNGLSLAKCLEVSLAVQVETFHRLFFELQDLLTHERCRVEARDESEQSRWHSLDEILEGAAAHSLVADVLQTEGGRSEHRVWDISEILAVLRGSLGDQDRRE